MNDAEAILAERNQLSRELAHAHIALGILANIFDVFLEKKGKAWCKHWESIPLHQLRSDGVEFRMPTLEDCRMAKAVAEGENPYE